MVQNFGLLAIAGLSLSKSGHVDQSNTGSLRAWRPRCCGEPSIDQCSGTTALVRAQRGSGGGMDCVGGLAIEADSQSHNDDRN